MPIVLKSGSLNILEPSGPVQACNGIALPLLWNSVSSCDVKQSYHPYYLFVVCNHLEFGLWILEDDPVYCHSFQLIDHACSKTGRSEIAVITEILWFVTADLGEWHCSCCHNHLLILCCMLQVVTKEQKGNISCHFVLRIAFLWGVNQCCFVDRCQQLKRTYMPYIQEDHCKDGGSSAPRTLILMYQTACFSQLCKVCYNLQNSCRIRVATLVLQYKWLSCLGTEKCKESYVYWTVHHLDSWIKIDQLAVICFIFSLFNAQHVSNVRTSIFRSLRLICWVISWVVLLWFDVCWCYGVVWLGWCGVVSGCRLKHCSTLVLQPA